MKPLTRRKFLETGLKFLGCAGVTALMPTRVLDTLSKKEVEKQECLLPGSMEYLGEKCQDGEYQGDAYSIETITNLPHPCFSGDVVFRPGVPMPQVLGVALENSVPVRGRSYHTVKVLLMDSTYCPNGIDHSDPKRRCRK